MESVSTLDLYVENSNFEQEKKVNALHSLLYILSEVVAD